MGNTSTKNEDLNLDITAADEDGESDVEVGDADAEDEVDDEADDDINPFHQAPYTTNRLKFAALAIIAVWLNSFTYHRWVSKKIIEVPEEKYNIPNVYERHQAKAHNFSNMFIKSVEEHYDELHLRMKATLTDESSRVDAQLVQNVEVLQEQQRHEHDVRMQYYNMVSYLQAWTRIGNVITYYPTVSDEDQLLLEASLQLEDGAAVQELADDSLSLKGSIGVRFNYDQEYIHNKTRGILPTLLPTIAASLQIPNLEDEIREIARLTRDQIVVVLEETREHFSAIYEALNQQLLDTQLGLETMGAAYLELLQTIRQFYNTLDSINLIGINASLFPRIDLDSFPAPEFFKPDIVVFPTTIDFLSPLDNLVALLATDFEIMVQAMLVRINVQVDTNVGEVISQLIHLLTPDDYNPPPIVFGKDRTILSPPEALQLDAEITANLTTQANSYLPPLPPPTYAEELPASFPDLEFARSTLALTEYPLFPWTVPTLESVPEDWKVIFRILLAYWVEIELIACKVAQTLITLKAYMDGTSVPEPVLDIRTKAEQRQQKKRKSSQSQWGCVCNLILDPMVVSVGKQVVCMVIFAITVWVGRAYYFNEFEPGCLSSNVGTLTFRGTTGLPYNQALTGGNARSEILQTESHSHMQQQCQLRSIRTYEAHQRQVLALDISKGKVELDIKRIERIQEQVDTITLCQQHKLACQSDDPKFICPTINGSVVDDPCNLMALSMQANATVLPDIKYICKFVPNDNSVVQEMTKRVQVELEVEESICMVEWWLISQAWRLLYTFVSVGIFHVAFQMILEGLRRIYWTKLRPEKYRSNSTTNSEGRYTQPEYSDPEEWKLANMEYKKTKYSFGMMHIAAGVLFLASYVLLTIRFAILSMEPVWFEDFKQG